MDVKRDFVLQALQPGANVSQLCRERKISRNCGYKWIRRFRERGIAGLEEISRRPRTLPTKTSGEVVLRIQELRLQHPKWGPKKLRHQLTREGTSAPPVRTIARVLERLGMPLARRRRRRATLWVVEKAPKVAVGLPNDLWTVDFKGWWRTQDRMRCEPLTVRDAASRFLLAARVLRSTRTMCVREAFERLFQQYGLPKAIQVDNGSPFACTRSRAGLTKLSAWWVSLGICVVRGRPGHPQDNGGHERMHRDMREDVEAHPEATIEAQQRVLDEWVLEFNEARPHEALGGRTPAEIYRRSTRSFRGPRVPRYPAAFEVRRVDRAGHLGYGPHYFVSAAVGGSSVGLEYVNENTRRIWYYDVDLGILDLGRPVPRKGVRIFIGRTGLRHRCRGRKKKRQPKNNLSPHVHEVSPMS